MLLTFADLISLLMLGEIPQGPGTVQSPGGKPVALAPETPAGETPPGEIPGAGVKETPSDTPGQPSPTTHHIIDSEFYAINPNKPTELTLGKHVKENMHLALQFSATQSKLHNAINDATTLKTENEQLKAKIQEFTDGAFVVNKLKELGIAVQDKKTSAPATTPTTVPQQYMTPEQIALAQLGSGVTQTDEWGNPIAPPANVPQPVPQGQMTITPETLPLLVAALKEAYKPDFNEALNELKTQASQQDQERSLKDQTGRYFTETFNSKIDSLVANGVDSIEANRIATIEREARESERQAEELYKVIGPQRAQSIELANTLMGQANTLRNDAAIARSQAMTLAQTAKTQQEAKDLLEEDSYVGVDQSKLLNGDPDEVRMYKESEIEAIKKSNLETAIKISEERERVMRSAGQ